MIAPRSSFKQFPASQTVSRPAADLPASEGLFSSPSTSDAGVYQILNAGQLGPQLARAHASVGIGCLTDAGILSLLTNEGDLLGVPEFRRRAYNRFKDDATPCQRASGREGMPCGAFPLPQGPP